ncbi:MAG TPA: farnesyl diphosphate synthase [Nitrospiria bacterium]|nr:farnesyl diphosphate synthase [Nitrospiria bacterium]
MPRLRPAVRAFELKPYLDDRRERVNRVLDGLLPAGRTSRGTPPTPPTIEAAMRYSLSAGGKRLRPVLAIAAAEAVGGRVSAAVLSVAASLELIHTYSLIHDDLPAMDNDDLRRGVPTSHRVFGEATAILAGDGLLTLAFELLSRPAVARAVPPRSLVAIIHEIARAAGYAGMVGGQLLDLQASRPPDGSPTAPHASIDEAGLERIHRKKTGALIRASVYAGALVGGAGPGALRALGRYGESIGLAFQIMDDILDVEGTSVELGKAVKNDQTKGKSTYPAVLGMEASKRKLAQAIECAIGAVARLGADAEPLRAIAGYVASRRV